MVFSITYRRPSLVSSLDDSISGEEKQKSLNGSIDSGSSCMSHGIPDALSFDRIISGGVCPPCTVRDFMNYLKYIEHSAENLQFFLWFRDYSERFEKLPASQKALSLEWTQAQAGAEAAGTSSKPKNVSPKVAAILKSTELFDAPAKIADSGRRDAFNTPPETPSLDEESDTLSADYASSYGDSKTLASSMYQNTAESAFQDAGMKWKPFTAQPYRDEVSRIITIYIADGGARQLNLSSREKTALLHALQNTTHPSAFRPILTTIEWTLRKQAHPNFIRWTVCNGNQSRIIFARGLGVATIFLSFVADLLITLSHAGRAWRVLPIIGWLVGVATLIAGWKGMCVVLHGMHHRHLRPWELFTDDQDDTELLEEKKSSVDTLVGGDTNSYEDEPWIARYRKRNIIRKVFDREVWIQEPVLRQIQDTIFLQSVLGGTIVSFIAVGIFCAVPHGNLY